MILNLCKFCFERIYIFSPSINVDSVWDPVKDFILKKMEAHETDDDKFYFDHYNPDALENIIATQTKIVKHMKAKGEKNYFKFRLLLTISPMIPLLVGIQNYYTPFTQGVGTV